MAATAVLSYGVWPLEPAAKKANSVSCVGTSLQLPVPALIAPSVAVAWHRLRLAGERAERLYLRLDGVVWRYFGYTLLFSLPTLVWGFAFSALAVPVNALALLAAILFPWSLWIFVVTRLGLVLPATAIEHRDVTLATSWHRTSGSFWPLFWGGALTFLPVIVLGIGLALVLPEPNSAPTSALSNCTWELIGLLIGIVAVGFLSIAFRHFYPESMPRNPTAPASA